MNYVQKTIVETVSTCKKAGTYFLGYLVPLKLVKNLICIVLKNCLVCTKLVTLYVKISIMLIKFSLPS